MLDVVSFCQLSAELREALCGRKCRHQLRLIGASTQHTTCGNPDRYRTSNIFYKINPNHDDEAGMYGSGVFRYTRYRYHRYNLIPVSGRTGIRPGTIGITVNRYRWPV